MPNMIRFSTPIRQLNLFPPRQIIWILYVDVLLKVIFLPLYIVREHMKSLLNAASAHRLPLSPSLMVFVRANSPQNLVVLSGFLR